MGTANPISVVRNNTRTQGGPQWCSSRFPKTPAGMTSGLRSSSLCCSASNHGTVRVHRRVFQRMLDQSPTPERCLEAFHVQRTRFELSVERKLRRRQLTDDGNVEINGRDLRERDPRPVTRVDRVCALETR